jgi:hypothetical protein
VILECHLASQRLVVAGIAEHGGQVGANQGLVIQGEQIGAADLRTGRAGQAVSFSEDGCTERQKPTAL